MKNEGLAPIPVAEGLAPIPVPEGLAPIPVLLEPKLPKHLRVHGPLVLEATIDRSGKVREVRIIRDGTDPSQGHAYIEAIKQWRFRPGMVRGKPVDVTWRCSVIIDVR